MVDVITFTLNPAIDVSTSVDRIAPIRKLRCSALRRDPGGGGINVARVISRLGGTVAAIYPAGGATGQLLRQLVDNEKIPSHTVTVTEETRENFAVSELTSGQQYRFVLPGPHVAESEWKACLDLLAAIQPRPRFLVASGSLPPGAPEDFYARVCRIAKEWNAKMILDTSGRPLMAAIEEGVYLIKPNLRELSELAGMPLADQAAWEEAGRHLVATKNIEVLALSLGHHGAFLATRERRLRARPIPITPASAVGAGDSFLGAMIWRLAAGQSLDDAFRHGVAAGAAALLNPGTELCRPDDVARLQAGVIVEAA